MKPIFSHLSVACLCLLSPACVIAASPAAKLHEKVNRATKAQTALAAPTVSPFARPLQGEKRFAHLLNRLAFGPRPGDIANVRQIGAGAWIEAQFAPQKIDDRALETQLAGFNWLHEKPARLMLAYESDTAGFLRRMKKAEAGVEAKSVNLSPRQQQKVAQIEAANLPQHASVEALGQLTTDKLARAIGSKRQLQEVLVDFWGNHFNVDVKKGPGRALKIVDDRDVIRPHVFGTFRELLGASARSPAMLFYLDNARSTKGYGFTGGKGKGGGGLNENYARELMELHTLGVDGGYTQKDVTEVARAFTGWSINPQNGEFFFRALAHDQGEKVVLGHRIAPGGGETDGEQVLDILAQNPATASFLARKLCLRFVSDVPPPALVDKVAAAFTKSGGDLRTTYRALFFAPEFFSEGAYRSKIKSPLEFTVSGVRALGGTLDTVSFGAAFRILAAGGASLAQGNKGNKMLKRLPKRPLAAEIGAMGEPLFACQPPTGYPENSTKWVSASALVSRLNFALALTAGRVGDVAFAEDTFRPASVEAVAQNLLNSDLSPATRATIHAEAQKTPGDGARLRALLMGSPEFQRR